MTSEDRFINPFSFPPQYPSVPRFAFDEAGTTSAAEAAPAAAPAPAASTTAPAGTSGAPDGGAPSAPAGATSSQEPNDPFAGLSGDFDGDDVIEIPEAPPTDGGAQAPGAQAAPPAQATPAAPPTSAAPQDPSAAVPPAPPSAATSSASPMDRLNEAIEGFKTHSAALSAHAAQTLFKLSDEDATALATNAEEVIPRLMGQVYTQSIAAAGNLMRNFIPQMIEAVAAQSTARAERSKEAIGEFYASNSDLNEKDHGQLVAKWAKSFRTANPSAPRKDAIAFVGRAVRAELGLPSPGAPAAPRQAPFAPARPGGRTPPPTQEHDPFAGLGMDFES